MKVYVASSWRNGYQPAVVSHLREVGHEVYDFKNPAEGDNGFHWSEIDAAWQDWSARQYRRHLSHPLAERGFAKDMDALRDCDACVLVQPCGMSAHLELGWAVGAGKRSVVLLRYGEPELMYKMVDHLCISLSEVEDALAAPSEERDE